METKKEVSKKNMESTVTSYISDNSFESDYEANAEEKEHFFFRELSKVETLDFPILQCTFKDGRVVNFDIEAYACRYVCEYPKASLDMKSIVSNMKNDVSLWESVRQTSNNLAITFGHNHLVIISADDIWTN